MQECFGLFEFFRKEWCQYQIVFCIIGQCGGYVVEYGGLDDVVIMLNFGDFWKWYCLVILFGCFEDQVEILCIVNDFFSDECVFQSFDCQCFFVYFGRGGVEFSFVCFVFIQLCGYVVDCDCCFDCVCWCFQYQSFDGCLVFGFFLFGVVQNDVEYWVFCVWIGCFGDFVGDFDQIGLQNFVVLFFKDIFDGI